MKTAIVYYSMHGNVRYVAEKVAKGLGADLIELKPVKAYPDKGAMQFIWGGSAVTFKKKPCLGKQFYASAPYIFREQRSYRKEDRSYRNKRGR